MSQRRSGRHGKPRKGINRYNPGAPDWRAVHAPWAKPRALPPAAWRLAAPAERRAA